MKNGYTRKASDLWIRRCGQQIENALVALEADRVMRPEPSWFGDRIGHADIAVAAVLRFLGEPHPDLVSLADFPALGAHAAWLEALPVFQAVMQPFIAPT
jgi:glutathione S-transferase